MCASACMDGLVRTVTRDKTGVHHLLVTMEQLVSVVTRGSLVTVLRASLDINVKRRSVLILLSKIHALKIISFTHTPLDVIMWGQL